ncbi:ankyrin repeat domain-containing protein 49-like [Cylas formicarius]|uniref:ankyrin repeat domain-containing protein 49-like n=1 Tax=Cylas formicarius TaxID=197179 RepID=UPI00295846F1|nr:ankyrin repeat domain-containing protein 49-like [Cylas formicarius]
MNDDTFLVSAWDDDAQGIDESRNPQGVNERKILEACENGDLETVKGLINEDPNLISVHDKDGYTPLHRACYGNHFKVAQYLIENGANVSSKTIMQWQPLHSCCQWNAVKCASLLIEAGADVNALSEGSQTPLHVAAAHGACYDMVQLLLMHPYIDATLRNNSNETAGDIARRSSKYYNVFDMADPLLDYKNIELLK